MIKLNQTCEILSVAHKFSSANSLYRSTGNELYLAPVVSKLYLSFRCRNDYQFKKVRGDENILYCGEYKCPCVVERRHFKFFNNGQKNLHLQIICIFLHHTQVFWREKFV